MAGNVRVVLKSVFDDTGIKQAQKQLGSISQNIDRAFSVAATAVAGATTAIGFFAKKSVDAASDLQESTNAVRVAYGDAAEAILAIGETSATSLGVARNEFNQAAVRFSAFAARVVGDGGDMSGFIKDISQRATDFASVFNIDVAEALQVFQSGLAGEAEPLKRFGINLLESEVKAYALRAGIIKVGESMTETQKVQARYGLLMESTAKTAGDFANTSDGLANSQRILKASITDLQAEIGSAFLPVVEDLFHEFSANLLPKLQELGAFLKSPQGEQAIKDMAAAFSTAFERVFEFIDYVMRNSKAIFELGATILGVITTLKVLNVVTKLVTGAQLLWNVAVAANPIGLLIVTLGLAVVAVQAFSKKVTESEKAVQKLTNNTMKLRQEQIQMIEKIKQGGVGVETYKKKLQELNGKLVETKSGFSTSAGEANRFNSIKLNGVRSELNKTGDTAAAMGQKIANANRELYYAMHPELAPPPPVAPTPTPTGGGSTGPTQSEQVADIIKDTQKAIASATKAYNKAVASAKESYTKSVKSANEAYKEATAAADKARVKGLADATKANADAIARINADTAKKLADIVAQSMARLTDAFRSAVSTNVAQMFATDEVGKSVDNLVTSLRERLQASQRLIQQSAQLSSAGFSQTFIEQVVGAGLEAGNELAAAVLAATPETQKELQSLYGQLETTSESGMDTLAQTIYDGAGLATQGLKDLYAQTLAEQQTSLTAQAAAYAEQQALVLAQFDEAMLAAGETRDKTLAEAMTAYTEALTAAADDFKESLNEIEAEFKEKIAELGKLKGALQNDINKLQKLIDEKQRLAGIAAQGGTVIAEIPKPAVKKTVVEPKTVINVNVKTDQTQSTKEVGKTIATAVNKYVIGGGTLVGGRTMV